jgi:hypothetical protein
LIANVEREVILGAPRSDIMHDSASNKSRVEQKTTDARDGERPGVAIAALPNLTYLQAHPPRLNLMASELR